MKKSEKISDESPRADSHRVQRGLSKTYRRVLDTLAIGASAAIELVLPPVCRLCNASVAGGNDFCRSCHNELESTSAAMRTACPKCGIPSSMSVNPAESVPTFDPESECLHCRSHNFQFDDVVAMWSYQGRVCDAVVAAKYAHNGSLADAMGRRLGQSIVSRLDDNLPDLVTFVPSHFSRQLTRGGNGIVTVAETAAASIDRPCKCLLRLKRRIAKQAWLSDVDRQKNVRDAFSVRKSYASPRSPRIANLHILVVDDVLTTGSTANEVASELKKVGVARVTLAVIARAVRGR